MSDIFDQVSGAGGDIFDSVAASKPEDKPREDLKYGRNLPPAGTFHVPPSLSGQPEPVMVRGKSMRLEKAPAPGAEALGQMKEGFGALSNPSWNEKAHGASQMVRGAFGLATPLAPFGLAAGPVRAAAALGTGMLAGGATENTVKALGVPSGFSELAGDVAGIAAGGKVAKWGSKENVAGAIGNVKDRIRQFDPAVRNPKGAIVRAIKPRNTRVSFEESLDRSLPELKAVESETGKPIQKLGDLLDSKESEGAITIAKRRIWNQLERMAGPQRKMGTQIDGNPIADAIERTIPKSLEVENPARAEAIRAVAKSYRRNFSIEEMEAILKEKNAALNSYYNEFPTAQRKDIAVNPKTSQDYAIADGARSGLYSAFDRPGGGAAAAELKQRYGSLMELEDAAFRRKNVADRQAPASLSEQVGKWTAAGHGLKAAGELFTGRPLKAAATAAQAVAEAKVSKWLKEQNTTDSLIGRAMGAYNKLPSPVPIPEQPTPAGLLGPGPIVTPPPADPSGVFTVHGQYPANAMAQRALPSPVRGLLGGPTVITPPPADTSYIRVTTGEPLRAPIGRQLPPGPSVRPPFDLSGPAGDVTDLIPVMGRDGKIHYIAPPARRPFVPPPTLD